MRNDWPRKSARELLAEDFLYIRQDGEQMDKVACKPKKNLSTVEIFKSLH